MGIPDDLEHKLQEWLTIGVVDAQTVGRIRAFESTRESAGVRWQVVLAIVFGALMVAAGVLLFVAAHWENLSPTQRFLLVLSMISIFHLAAGAFMPRMRALGLALHAVGTAALGAGIFLAGQIFNLQEHWPGGVLLWALGATLSWAVLRDWPQALLAALLVPAWMASEWSVRTEHFRDPEILLFEFFALLAITYLSAYFGTRKSAFRLALTCVGGLAVLPLCAALAVTGRGWSPDNARPLTVPLHAVGILMAFLLPLLAAWLLRGKAAFWNIGFAVWVVALGLLDDRDKVMRLLIFALCALGAIGLALWGLREERRERINLGIAGFAITVIAFYFSTVMDKLGRSAALVGFGVLFLFGGWKLEQLRRKLVARAAGSSR